jgi:hypothetical protein
MDGVQEMTMPNTDHVFVIGDSHKVCEDYAWSESSDKGAIALVSDGCSGSDNTDIGARLLVLHAAMRFKGDFLDGLLSKRDFDHVIFGADDARKALGLERTVLDATLLGIRSWEFDGTWLSKTFSAGDGYKAYMSDSGYLKISKLEAGNGYPKYLSYRLDSARNHMVSKVAGDSRHKISTVFESKGKMEFDVDCANYVGQDIEWEDASSDGALAVFSDGVDTFTDAIGQTVPVESVIWELMSFKNTKGEFVKRRMQGFLKKARKAGWKHDDDLSMAAIHFGDRG